MESYVNCPACGELARVVMKPYAGEGLMADLMQNLGIGKTSHFEGEGKCKCGKLLIASLHVTAE